MKSQGAAPNSSEVATQRALSMLGEGPYLEDLQGVQALGVNPEDEQRRGKRVLRGWSDDQFSSQVAWFWLG